MGFGSDDPVIIAGAPRCRFPSLVSYAYLRDLGDAQIDRIVNDPRREVLLDSGAFTAFNAGKTILLADYIAFLKKWGPSLFGYMLLDKLQDPVQTEANWQTMLSEGLTPVPIHVYGEGKAQMDAFFERSPYVALGGLRRPHRGAAPPEYVKQKMTWAGGRRVHWLGYTNERMIDAFRPFSVDCATCWSSAQYGMVSIYVGHGEWWSGEYGDYIAVSPDVRRRLHVTLAAYCLDVRALDDANCWRWQPVGTASKYTQDMKFVRQHSGVDPLSSSNVVAHVAVRSFVRYAFDIRRRYGTRMFLAQDPQQRHDRIVDCALEVAHLRGWDRPLGVAP